MMATNLRYVLDEQGIELTTDILELAVKTTVDFLLSPGQQRRVSEETGLPLETVALIAERFRNP